MERYLVKLGQNVDLRAYDPADASAYEGSKKDGKEDLIKLEVVSQLGHRYNPCKNAQGTKNGVSALKGKMAYGADYIMSHRR
jgi:hypothetical protein